MALNPKAQARLTALGFSSLDEYYDSEVWSKFRNYIAKKYRENGLWFCWACKCKGNRFDLHHIRYHNFACFNLDEIKDIKILCKSCHYSIHGLMKSQHMTLMEATEYVLSGKLKPTAVIRKI